MSKFNLQRLTTKINSAYVGAVLAQNNPSTGAPTAPIKTTQDAVGVVNQVANFLFALFLALAVIFLIVAALFYLTAAGNQTQLDRAKNTLIYSIVAIVIALIAGGLTSFVGDLLGTSSL